MAWSTWKDMAQQQTQMLQRAHACVLRLQGSSAGTRFCHLAWSSIQAARSKVGHIACQHAKL